MKKKVREIVDFSKSSHTAWMLCIEILLGISAVISSLYIFAKLADHVLDKETILFDHSIMQFVYAFRSTEMTEIMTTITFFGGEIFIGIAIVITILILQINHKKEALVFAFLLFFGIALNLLLKDLFQRPRPDLAPLIYEATYSFPSGHSMNSFVFFMSLSYFIFRNTHKKILGVILSICSGILILMIGLSRIYLGVHYPSDVLAGFAGGAIWFVSTLLFEKTIIFFSFFQKYEQDKKQWTK